jgi:hypothetical protein
MRRHFVVAAVAGLLGWVGMSSVSAQTLDMVNPPQASTSMGTPDRGMLKSQVERKFGAPTERVAAVGNPPISQWVYPTFIVYFEYDHVIHAVATPAK